MMFRSRTQLSKFAREENENCEDENLYPSFQAKAKNNMTHVEDSSKCHLHIINALQRQHDIEIFQALP